MERIKQKVQIINKKAEYILQGLLILEFIKIIFNLK